MASIRARARGRTRDQSRALVTRRRGDSRRRGRGTVRRCAHVAHRRGRQKRPSRSDRARRRSPTQAVRQAEHRVTVSLPSRRVAAGARRRAPRPDELRQDVRRAEGARGEARRASTPARCACSRRRRTGGSASGSGRARRARHRRGAGQRARARHLLDGRDGAARGRAARPRRGAVGRRHGARLRVDAPSARGRVPRDPAARRARCAPARASGRSPSTS